MNISPVYSWQSSTRGETKTVQRRDLLKDASQACAQLQLWSAQWGQRSEGQHGCVTGYKHINRALLSWKQHAVQMFLFLCSSGADSPRSSEPLPLAVAKEAKVSDMEDDQLGEEDVIFLDDKWVSSLHNFCSVSVFRALCVVNKQSSQCIALQKMQKFNILLARSGWRVKMRARKKNWFCLKTVSSSPSLQLFQVV